MLRHKLWVVGLFAIAMAYLESAVVVYLRDLYGIEDIARDIPDFDTKTAAIEVGREAATMLMLLTVGWIAGRSLQSRIAFAFFTFGVWDIFYYFWLWVFLGWPTSLFDTDLLFLIPLPWWGPVLSPILIALLMVVGGVMAILQDDRQVMLRPTRYDWALLFLGVLIVLYSFMADALAALPISPNEVNKVEPTAFKWPIYFVGFALMTWAVWHTVNGVNNLPSELD